MNKQWTDEEITAYALNELPRVESDNLRADLYRDNALRTRMERIQGLNRALSGHCGNRLSPGLTIEQRESILNIATSTRPSNVSRWPWLATGGIAALAALMLLIYRPVGTPRERELRTPAISAEPTPESPAPPPVASYETKDVPNITNANPQDLRLNAAYEEAAEEFAVFVDPTGDIVRLRVGDSYGAYVLDSLEFSPASAIFRHVETQEEFQMSLIPETIVSEPKLLEFQETPKGWAVRIQTGPRMKKWYYEGDKFESFELVGVDAGAGCVDIFDSKADEFFTLCAEDEEGL